MTLRLLIALVLFLPGCSRHNSQPLRAVVVEGPVGDAFAAAVEEAKLSVEVTELSYSELEQAARNTVSPTSRRRPSPPSYDLVMLDDTWLPEFAPGLEELKGPPGSDFVEQFLQLGRDNQRLVALPFVANAQVFFRDERYVPTPPATWDDALRQAAGIEKKYHIPGFAIRGAFGNSLTADFLPLLWVHGGTIDPERGQFTLGPAVKALDLMKRMATQAAPGFLGFGTAEVRSQLKTGQAAMGVGWLSSVVALEANFAYSGLPGLNKSEREGQSAFSTWLLAIPKQSKRKDDTVKLLDELMKKDVLEAVSKQSIPVLKSLTGKVGYRLPGCSRARPRGKRSTDIATKFSFAISQVLTGATPKEAMCNLQREIGKLTIAPSVGRQ